MYYRSLLFVPGNRPERFDKACAAGADLVCIDLEDAVGPNDKDTARVTVLDWLQNTSHGNVSVRINALDTDAGRLDIAALVEAKITLPFVMVPKLATAAQIVTLDNVLHTDLGAIFPVIESAEGLLNASQILANPRVNLALFGAVDFSADLGCTLDWDALLHARSHLAVCAAAHDAVLFDVPYLDVRDPDGCEAETKRVAALGIHARSAIHPAQIGPIHQALSPTVDDIAQAERVMAAYTEANGNVALLDGKLIETPLVKRAERILAFKE